MRFQSRESLKSAEDSAGQRDYTLIDIPITAVAQANFLRRVLGEKPIQLYGESEAGGVRILPPAMFLGQEDRFDVALNVNSLTEMAPVSGDMKN